MYSRDCPPGLNPSVWHGSLTAESKQGWSDLIGVGLPEWSDSFHTTFTIAPCSCTACTASNYDKTHTHTHTYTYTHTKWWDGLTEKLINLTYRELKSDLGLIHSLVWQIITCSARASRKRLFNWYVRKKLYGLTGEV